MCVFFGSLASGKKKKIETRKVRSRLAARNDRKERRLSLLIAERLYSETKMIPGVAMMKEAVDAAETVEALQEFLNKTPPSDENPERDELLKLLSSQLPLVRQVCHTHLQVLKGYQSMYPSRCGTSRP